MGLGRFALRVLRRGRFGGPVIPPPVGLTVEEMLDPMVHALDPFTFTALSLRRLLPTGPQAYDPASGVCTWSIEGGNAGGRWALIGDQLMMATGKSAADLLNSTDVLTIRLVDALAGIRAETTLKLIVPGEMRYVDPVNGNDNAVGTQAAPWAHMPGDPLAVSGSLAASYNPGQPAGVNVMGGAMMRSSVTATRANIIYMSNRGYGTGRAILSGMDDVGQGVAATGVELSGNPDVSSIRKVAISGGFTIGRHLKQGETLLTIAQWPPAGADPILDAQDANRHLTGGMFRLPTSEIVTSGSGAETVATIGGSGAAAVLSEFGAIDLTGYMLWVWISGNVLTSFPISAHNLSTGQLSFVIGTRTLQDLAGTNAFQVAGHPWSIKGPAQFAAKIGDSAMFAWPANASNFEASTRFDGFNCNSPSASSIHGFQIEGQYADTLVTQGAGIGVSRTPSFSLLACDNVIRFQTCGNAVSAGVRTTGGGASNISTVTLDRNVFDRIIRSGGYRLSTLKNTNPVIVGNLFSKITRTIGYMANADNPLIRGNYAQFGLGQHANGFTCYISNGLTQTNVVIAFNICENVARPLTKDPCANWREVGNIWECDAVIKDGTRNYGSESTERAERNIYVRRRGDSAFSGNDALAAGDGPIVYDRCIIDGVAGTAGGPIFTDCLIVGNVSGSGIDDAVVTAAGAVAQIGGQGGGNSYQPSVFDGEIPPAWAARLGRGRVGNRLVL